jgi:hypothetical protein
MLNPRQDVRNNPRQCHDRKVVGATPSRSSVFSGKQLLVFHGGLLGIDRVAPVSFKRYFAAWRGETHLVQALSMVKALAEPARAGLRQCTRLVSKIHEHGANRAQLDRRIFCAGSRAVLPGDGPGLGRLVACALVGRWLAGLMVVLAHDKNHQCRWDLVEASQFKRLSDFS